MKNLTDFIEWLQSNDKHRFEIYDAVSESRIDKEKCLSNKSIVEAYGSIENYFMDLVNRGIQKIAIQRTRKHGNTEVRLQELPKKFEIGQKSTNVEQVERGGGIPNNGAAVPQPHFPAPQPAMGMMGAMGLNGLQIMDMNTKASKYDEVKAEKEKLERKCEILEKENKDLERANLRHELGVEGKPGTGDKIIEALTKVLEPGTLSIVMEKIMAAKQGGGQPALNAPETSRIKAEVIKALYDPSITDEMVQAAYRVIYETMSGNQAFVNQFNQLLNSTTQQNATS